MFSKYRAALCAGVAVLALSTQAHAATLSDSVTAAMKTHPAVEGSKAAREAARRSVREQQSGFFPVLGLNAAAGRQNTNNDTTRGFTGNDATSWVGQGGVTLTQPIFAGFGTLNRTRAAHERFDSALYDVNGAEEDVGLRAARAHLNLMRTKELLDIAREYYSEIQRRNSSIELMVREGAAEESELMQSAEMMMSANNTRLGYEEAWQQAEADYIEVAGAPPAGNPEFGPAVWDRLLPVSSEEAVQGALAGNPRLLSMGKLATAMGREAAATRADLMPHLDAAVSYDLKDQDDALGGESEDAAAMLRMSWNFSTGGAELARVGRGDAEYSQAAARRAQAARDAEHDARQKFNSMKIVDQQFTVLAAREQEVKKMLDSFTKQFDAGKQSNLELIVAHGKLFEASASRTDAYYRKLLSRFELLGVMGRLRSAFGAEPMPAVSASAPKSADAFAPEKKPVHVPPPPGARDKVEPRDPTNVLKDPLPKGYTKTKPAQY